MNEIERRGQIIAITRTWLGTPFVDGQGLKRFGVDCAHLPALVAEEAGLVAHIDLPYYSPQIYLHKLGDDTYEKILLQYTREITEAEIKPGDIVVFKVAKSFTHGGIIESWPDKIIHPIHPHGVIYSSANEGFVARRARRFFSIFGKAA
jgi:cell wall-associated NlpC family hydrolase